MNLKQHVCFDLNILQSRVKLFLLAAIQVAGDDPYT